MHKYIDIEIIPPDCFSIVAGNVLIMDIHCFPMRIRHVHIKKFCYDIQGYHTTPAGNLIIAYERE